MNLNNIELDTNFVRSQFPAFRDQMCLDWSFFENAGGSYVPKSVIDKLTNFMISTKVQPYAEYPMSKIAGEQMDMAIAQLETDLTQARGEARNVRLRRDGGHQGGKKNNKKKTKRRRRKRKKTRRRR